MLLLTLACTESEDSRPEPGEDTAPPPPAGCTYHDGYVQGRTWRLESRPGMGNTTVEEGRVEVDGDTITVTMDREYRYSDSYESKGTSVSTYRCDEAGLWRVGHSNVGTTKNGSSTYETSSTTEYESWLELPRRMEVGDSLPLFGSTATTGETNGDSYRNASEVRYFRVVREAAELALPFGVVQGLRVETRFIDGSYSTSWSDWYAEDLGWVQDDSTWLVETAVE